MARHRIPSVVAALALLAALVGCDASPPDDPATTPATSTSARPSTSASASASPAAFTATCDDALALVDVSKAAGQPIVGDTSFVVGEADPSIGRVAYLNCRYGLPAAPDPSDPAAPAPSPTSTGPVVPAVEIGVSRYDTAGRATQRVEGTVADYRSTGAAATDVSVGDARGTLLTTTGQPRTLVVADGTQTVAVSMSDAVFTGEQQIAAVAALALAVR